MLIRRFVAWMFSISLVGLTAGVASGQNYPNKPLRLVTSGIGGGGDFTARLVARGLSGLLGQPVIVDNRGSNIIPGDIVSKAPPDGYTLLVHGGAFWVGSLLQKAPYDPLKDFAPITLVTRQPAVLVVNPSVPVKSVKELIALAKAKPGELNYASSQTGSTTHLSAELFKSMAGVDIVRIPYKSGTMQMSDLIGGHVQLTFGNANNVAPHVKSGRLRALAVTTVEPSALLPDLPTVAASGLPGFEAAQMSGVFAPAKTSEAIINRLNQEIVRLVKTPEAREQFLDSGVEPVGSSPEQLAIKMRSEMARMGKVIQDLGIRNE